MKKILMLLLVGAYLAYSPPVIAQDEDADVTTDARALIVPHTYDLAVVAMQTPCVIEVKAPACQFVGVQTLSSDIQAFEFNGIAAVLPYSCHYPKRTGPVIRQDQIKRSAYADSWQDSYQAGTRKLPLRC